MRHSVKKTYLLCAVFFASRTFCMHRGPESTTRSPEKPHEYQKPTVQSEVIPKLPELPGEYQKPTTEMEAADQWEEAEQRAENANKIQRALFEERKKAMLASSTLGGTYDATSQEAYTKYQNLKEQEAEARTIATAWENRKLELQNNELVKSYIQRLQAVYEQPIEPFQEPDWWTKIRKNVELWVKNRQLDYYSWIEIPEKIDQIRNDIEEISAQLGKQNFLQEAKKNEKILRSIKELDKKIGKTFQIFNTYAQKMNNKELKPQDKQEIKNEVQKLITNLIVLKNQLEKTGFDQKIREIVDEKIQKVFSGFNISLEEQKKFEELPQQKETSDVDALVQMIEQKKATLEEWAIGNIASYDAFNQDLNALAKIDISTLPPVKQGKINLLLRDGYQKPYNTFLKTFLSEKPITEKSQASLLDQFLRTSLDYFAAEDRYATWWVNFIKKNAAPPTKTPTETELPQNYDNVMKKSLEPMTDKVIKNLSTKPLRYYNKLIGQIDEFEKYIQNKAISTVKLLCKQVLLIDVFGTIINHLNNHITLEASGEQQHSSAEDLAQILANSVSRSHNLSKQLDYDRAAMIVQNSENELVAQTQASPSPAQFSQSYEESIENKQIAFQAKKESNEAQILLNAVKGEAISSDHGLLSQKINQEHKLSEVLLKGINARSRQLFTRTPTTKIVEQPEEEPD